MDVSIIIVSYNTRALTLACLKSVYEQTTCVQFEVIVVDNTSTDGSPEAISRDFPAVKLILPGENLGFARANNEAARQAGGKYLLLLNPDTVILEHAIDRVVKFADDNPRAGIVGGRTFFADGRLNRNSCHGHPTLWSLFCLGTGLSSAFRKSRWLNPESYGAWQRDTVRDVDAVTGCFLLIDFALWRRLEGFDESFFIYGEDTDLCVRCWDEGRACMICPDAKLIHYGGASDRVRPDKMVRLFRARVQFLAKHWGPLKFRLGVAAFQCWAFTRMSVLNVLRTIQPRRKPDYETWREIWQRRAEFSHA
jgi:GT2 family glycosyltransferase